MPSIGPYRLPQAESHAEVPVERGLSLIAGHLHLARPLGQVEDCLCLSDGLFDAFCFEVFGIWQPPVPKDRLPPASAASQRSQEISLISPVAG